MTRFQTRQSNIDKINKNWNSLSDEAKRVVETTDDDFIFEIMAEMTANELNAWVKEEF